MSKGPKPGSKQSPEHTAKVAAALKARSHGKVGTGAYTSWYAMKARCTNPKNKSYESYGARGITFCAEWKTFENFFADMGERPEGTTLDRIDGTKGYSPDNCRWATYSEQRSNQTRPMRMADCHPDRKHCAKGLCRACYKKGR